jgi:hypothetical protein
MTCGDSALTWAVGTKFFPDGRVRPFAGNSIVCPLSPSSPLYSHLARLQQRCRAASFGPCFAILPPESFHMTLIDLLCDQVRQPEHWSSKLSLECPLDEADRRLVELIGSVSFPRGPAMTVLGLGPLRADLTLHVHLEPADAETGDCLAAFREEVSRRTGIRHPSHDSYFFHISLAYPIRELSGAEGESCARFLTSESATLRETHAEVHLEVPHLAFFDDMHAFPERRRSR